MGFCVVSVTVICNNCWSFLPLEKLFSVWLLHEHCQNKFLVVFTLLLVMKLQLAILTPLPNAFEDSLSESSTTIVRLMFVALHKSNHFKCCLFSFRAGPGYETASCWQDVLVVTVTKCLQCLQHLVLYICIFNKLVISHLCVVIFVIVRLSSFRSEVPASRQRIFLFLDLTVLSVIFPNVLKDFGIFGWSLSNLRGPTHSHILSGSVYQAGHFHCKNLRCCSLLPLQWRWQQAAAKHW